MVNYICRTCLYVSEDEFSVRKLEKVKPVLEMFIPEIKTCIKPYSLICEQCYYFLKLVEKFKVKCIKTQKKLYSMNEETIRQNHDVVFQPVAVNDMQIKRADDQENSAKKAKRSVKVDNDASTYSSVSNDLLHLFNCDQDTDDLMITPPAVKSSHKVSKFEYDDGEKANNSDEDEYMTRKDLVAAGILTDYAEKGSSNNQLNIMEDFNSDGDLEAMLMSINDTNQIGGKKVEIKTAYGRLKNENSPSMMGTKIEEFDDENPGFFNKQSPDGFYKCKLCDKRYKTSKRLYTHTKEKHGDELTLHHCERCWFFTKWRSALERHKVNFHGDISQQNSGSSVMLKCYHCHFQAASKDRLRSHILEDHSLQ